MGWPGTFLNQLDAEERLAVLKQLCSEASGFREVGLRRIARAKPGDLEPDLCGVYAFRWFGRQHHGEWLYVGQSVNVSARVRTHLVDEASTPFYKLARPRLDCSGREQPPKWVSLGARLRNARAYWTPTSPRNLNHLEALFIGVLRPMGNAAWKAPCGVHSDRLQRVSVRPPHYVLGETLPLFGGAA